MNAPNSLNQHALEGKAAEPSMEEILASIRRIIADDQIAMTQPKSEPQERQEPAGKPGNSPAEARHGETTEPAAVSQPVLETAVPEPCQEAPEGEQSREHPRAEFRRVVGPEDFAALAREMRPGRHRAPPKETAEPLVSPVTDAAVSASFNSLVATRFLQSEEQIEDMVRDMLRPMLKTWLDDNLPILVERLVRAEIERVARGGR